MESKKQKQKYTLKYRRTTLTFDFNPRKIQCECCERKGKLDNHHFIYEFTTKEVKKNKLLALKNCATLCFVCHNLANCLNHILADNNKERVEKLKKLMEKSLNGI